MYIAAFRYNCFFNTYLIRTSFIFTETATILNENVHCVITFNIDNLWQRTDDCRRRRPYSTRFFTPYLYNVWFWKFHEISTGPSPTIPPISSRLRSLSFSRSSSLRPESTNANKFGYDKRSRGICKSNWLALLPGVGRRSRETAERNLVDAPDPRSKTICLYAWLVIEATHPVFWVETWSFLKCYDATIIIRIYVRIFRISKSTRKLDQRTIAISRVVRLL